MEQLDPGYVINEAAVRAAILIALACQPMTRRRVADLLLLPDGRVYRHLKALRHHGAVRIRGRRGGASWALRCGQTLMAERARHVVFTPAEPVPQDGKPSWWTQGDFYEAAHARAKARGWE